MRHCQRTGQRTKGQCDNERDPDAVSGLPNVSVGCGRSQAALRQTDAARQVG